MDKQMIKTRFEKGLSAFQSGQLNEALALFSSILKEAPHLADAFFLAGVTLFRLGRPQEALKHLETAVQRAPDNEEFCLNYALVLKELKEWRKAEQVLNRVVEMKPQWVQARAELLLVLRSMQEWEKLYQALDGLPLFESPDLIVYYMESTLHLGLQPNEGWEAFIERIVLQFPGLVGLAAKLGRLLLEKKEPTLAALLLDWGLKSAPEHPVLLAERGACAMQTKAYAEAVQLFEKALHFSPEDESLRFNLIQALASSERELDLIPLLERPFQAREFHALLYDLGEHYWLSSRAHIALPIFEHVKRYFPKKSELYERLAQVSAELDCITESRAYYQQARQLCQGAPAKDALYQLMSIFLVPRIHFSSADLQECYERIEKEFSAFQKKYASQKFNFGVFPENAFLMAYHDYDMRPIMEALGELVSIPVPQLNLSPNAQVKVGVVSELFKDHSVSHCFFGVVKALCDALDFEVTLIMTGQGEDAVTQQYREMADHYLIVDDIQNAPSQISALGLDALAYLDLGMSQKNYSLACHRLAPVQMTFAGHPVTTGLSNMDYFISHVTVENEETRKQYTEELVLLPSSVVVYQKPILPETLKSKAELGLDENANNYICPMTLFKVHPDFDFAVAEILRRDPLGKVYFFEYGRSQWGEQLRARFEREIPDVLDRIVFLPWTPKEDFLQILALSDVVLDTFYFGAGNTSYLCLGIGSPILTWPGKYTRGRHVYGHWKRLGLEDGIATSAEDYIEKAVKIARDKPYQKQLRQKIQAHNAVLFENDTGVIAFKSWLKELVSELNLKESPRKESKKL